MAFDVFLKVYYEDAGPFTVVKEYLCLTQLATDFSNWAAVNTQIGEIITVLDALTWDHISNVDVIIRQPQSGAAANIAANNSVEAFHRMTNANGKKVHFIVPAWDDEVFDKNPNGSMSVAYNTAASALAPITRDPGTLETWTYNDAQNRATKRGQRQFKP